MFFGEKTGRRPFFGGERSVCPFSAKIKGLARVQGRSNDPDPRPRGQGCTALFVHVLI
jgi:hypothetical protein